MNTSTLPVQAADPSDEPSRPDPRAPVLLVGNFLEVHRGSRFLCEDLAERLRASGRRVTTTSSHRNRGARLLDMLATTYRMRRGYAVAQVDVFSGPSFMWAEVVCTALRLLRKPHALVLRGGNLPAFSKRWPRRVSRLLNGAGMVATPSRYLYEQMAPYCRALHLLPNPLDLSRYHFVRRTTPRPRLVWLRAFHEVYNPSLAPRALSRIVEQFPNAQLTMVGRDTGDGSLQRTRTVASGCGVLERLELPGVAPKRDVPDWLAQGDVFLNTASVDNTPVSVLEAMACGLCVVSTNVGGIPYLLEDEHDALLVPSDDPEAMAHAIRRILTDRELAARLSGNARRKAENFDWSVILPLWDELFSTLARSAGSSRPANSGKASGEP